MYIILILIHLTFSLLEPRIVPPCKKIEVVPQIQPSSCARARDASVNITLPNLDDPKVVWNEVFNFSYRWQNSTNYTERGFPLNYPTPYFVFGKCGMGVYIEQNNTAPKAHLYIPYSLVGTRLDADFMIAFWFKGSAFSKYQAMLNQRGSCIDHNYWSFYAMYGDVYFEFNHEVKLKSSRLIRRGHYFHIAATNLLGNITLYVDGVAQQSMQTVNNYGPNFYDVFVGFDKCNNKGRIKNGTFDDVIITDKFVDPFKIYSKPCRNIIKIGNETYIDNIASANYSFSFTSTSCAGKHIQYVYVPAKVRNETALQITNCSCFGKSDGSFNISYSGNLDFPTYWYLQNGTLVGIGNYINYLDPNVYEARDGCSEFKLLSATIYAPEELQASTPMLTCENGICNLTINITGGSNPVIYFNSSSLSFSMNATQGVNKILDSESMVDLDYAIYVKDKCKTLPFIVTNREYATHSLELLFSSVFVFVVFGALVCVIVFRGKIKGKLRRVWENMQPQTSILLVCKNE